MKTEPKVDVKVGSDSSIFVIVLIIILFANFDGYGDRDLYDAIMSALGTRRTETVAE